MKSIKIFGILTSGFGHNKTERFCSEMSREYKGEVAQKCWDLQPSKIRRKRTDTFRNG